MRRLLSVSCVAGLDEGRPLVRDLVSYGADGHWHRVSSLEAMPERVRAKLASVDGLSCVLDGFDA